MVGQPNELYGSHLPLLTKIMEITHGDVLELGMGLYSTPLLHTLCFLQNRRLVSYDNDREWYQENSKWRAEKHEVYLIDDWQLADIENVHWSVAFVDHKPAKQRMKEIKRLANNCNFVIIHDSEPVSDKYFKYSWIYKYFKYRYDYTKFTPNTTVLSNFIDVNSVLS